ncbi:TPA: hypothetical protein I6187_003534 [Vibrio cholerae]|uniref:hypothetical protein n=1 Tax=Vibrio cholerae TaxID=666 RepID=UPI001A3507D4|nr:hypothetical protein [Vibrio cholerae]MCQ0983378.1 hypothetical protein [Vibrio cholerae]GHX14117.1 hypothetical protein VCSRO60_3547 [Vibrio cholerae]HAS3638551.1 hypothetical protein [Vibrio cholerae]
MNRGLYSSMITNNLYRDSDKEWVVELETYHRYWYDLVVNPCEIADYFDTRKLIVNHLKQVKKEVEEHLEKRFVYFICSRERVRFNTDKKPVFNPFTKTTKLHLLVGENATKKSIKFTFYDINTSQNIKPDIQITDKYITFKDPSGYLSTYPIHDFLEMSKINLGIYSKVEYVGYTKNPHTRPTNGAHTGLSDVLYKIAEEKRDTIIYFNVFKVLSQVFVPEVNIQFNIANSMTNEVDVELEGQILEKCFIFYFDSKNQTRNKSNERKELEGSLVKIANENKIKAIHIAYEFESSHEYGMFFSSKIAPDKRHIFTVSKDSEGIIVKQGSTIFDKLV